MTSCWISYTLLAAFTASLLAMTGDTTITWTSPMFVKLNSTDSRVNPVGEPITDTEQSLIGSILNIGAIIGPFPFGFLAQKYGRKIALLSVALPHLLGYSIATFSNSVYLYYISRFISGIAVGGGYATLPMYVAEIAEDSNRGSLSVVLNVFWTFGNLIPLALGPFTSAFYFNLVLTSLPIFFFVLFFFLAPETPYYLVGANDLDKAEDSLIILRSKKREDVKDEIIKIKNCLEQEAEGTFLDLFRSRSVIKSLIISIVLIAGQQLSGINAVLMYAQPIFIDSGSNLSSDVCSVIIGLIIFSTSFSTPFLADRFGRKTLLIASNIGALLSHAVFGAYFYLYEKTEVDVKSISWIPILTIVLYIAAFNVGLGPLPWTISSELFPSNVKSVGSSATAFTCWLTSFIVTNYFTDLNKAIGTAGTFWLFGGCCLVISTFTFFYVPETRGKSFDDIQRNLNGYDNKAFEEK